MIELQRTPEEQPRTPAEPPPALQNDSIFAGGPVLVGEGLGFVEGPVWLPTGEAQPGFPDGGGYFVFCSLGRGTSGIYRWPVGKGADGKVDLAAKPVVLLDSGARSIGLAVASPGVLLACSVEGRAIVRLAFDGKQWQRTTVVDKVAVEKRATDKDGKTADAAVEPQRLNATNDVVVGPGGEAWFSDPAFFTPADQLTIGYNGVYRIDGGGVTSLATRGVAVPNGVALSPDGKTLYVNDFRAGTVLAMDVLRPELGGTGTEVTLGPSRVVIDLRAECARRGIKASGNCDGVRCDETGILYTTGPGGIWVVDPSKPEGQRALAHLDLAATNLALGPALDEAGRPLATGRTMFVTGAGGKVWRVGLK